MADASEDRVSFDPHDVKQDERLTEIETKQRIHEEKQGTVNLGESARIISVAFVLISSFAAMYVEWKTSPQVTNLSLAERDIQEFQKDVERLAVDLEKLSIANDALKQAQSETLDVAVFEERFQFLGIQRDQAIGALQLLIEGLEGRMTRIINERITPRMDRFDKRLSAIEGSIVEEIKRQRDQSPITVEEQ